MTNTKTSDADIHVDDEGDALFTAKFEHQTYTVEEEHVLQTAKLDVIETNGNVWFSAPQALALMGFTPHAKGGYHERLKRLCHLDVIKIKDTPFSFSDKRRNRGALISPRAVLEFANSKVPGQNTIASIAFVEWIYANLFIDEQDAIAFSPAKDGSPKIAPVFRSVVSAIDEDEQGRPLDPSRPVGLYAPMATIRTLAHDEGEFCLCNDERVGLGRWWCNSRGGFRFALPTPFVPYSGDMVVDDNDDFWG